MGRNKIEAARKETRPFLSVNAGRGKLLSHGYPAVRISARLSLPGFFLSNMNDSLDVEVLSAS
jgi:hypothetical protein